MVCYFDCNTIQIFKFMAGVSLATSLHQDIPDYDLGQIHCKVIHCSDNVPNSGTLTLL